MTVSVRLGPEAEHQIDELSVWWRAHRSAARSLKSLLRAAFQRIAAAPHAGASYQQVGSRLVRRVMIKSTPYAAYYYVDEVAAEAIVISVWSCQRGEGPSLIGR